MTTIAAVLAILVIGLLAYIALGIHRTLTPTNGAMHSHPTGLRPGLTAIRSGRCGLVGLDGCYCVPNTTRGALNRGYDVTIVDDCVLTAFPDRWEKVKDDLEELRAEVEIG